MILEAKPAHVRDDLVIDFDYFHPRTHQNDLHLAWKELQDQSSSDVVWTPHNGGHWILLRGKDMHAFLRDIEHVEDRIVLLPPDRDFMMIPLAMNAPASLKYRALLNYDLSPRRVNMLADVIRRIAATLIEELKDSGECEFIEDFANKLPTILFMELCNLPMKDAPRLSYVTKQLSKPDGSMTLEEAIAEIMAYVTPFIMERRETPGDDLLSRLANGVVDGQRVSFEEALSLTSIALFGGLDTVAASLGLAFRYLAEQPKLRATLTSDPSKLPGAVDEIFRRLAVPLTSRRVKADVEIAGATLKAGDYVLLPLMLHGLDEREYPDPMTFDLDRKQHATSTFGNGYHMCPGRLLARTEMTIAIEEWLNRIPEFAIPDDEEVTMMSGGSMIVNNLPLRWKN